jgi:prophage regulatory protein
VLFHQPPMPKPNTAKTAPAFYRLREVVRMTALSRSTVYRRISEGRFPAPVSLGGRASRWLITSRTFT